MRFGINRPSKMRFLRFRLDACFTTNVPPFTIARCMHLHTYVSHSALRPLRDVKEDNSDLSRSRLPSVRSFQANFVPMWYASTRSINILFPPLRGLLGVQLDWYSPTRDIRHITLTQCASGTSQIFPVKKLQVDIPSGSQSVAGVNFNVQSPLDVVRVLSLRFKGGK